MIIFIPPGTEDGEERENVGAHCQTDVLAASSQGEVDTDSPS